MAKQFLTLRGESTPVLYVTDESGKRLWGFNVSEVAVLSKPRERIKATVTGYLDALTDD